MWLDNVCTDCLNVVYENYDMLVENHDTVSALRRENERLRADNAAIIAALTAAVDAAESRGVKRSAAGPANPRPDKVKRQVLRISVAQIMTILPTEYRTYTPVSEITCPNPECNAVVPVVTKKINQHFANGPCKAYKDEFEQQLFKFKCVVPMGCDARSEYQHEECMYTSLTRKGLIAHIRQAHKKYLRRVQGFGTYVSRLMPMKEDDLQGSDVDSDE